MLDFFRGGRGGGAGAGGVSGFQLSEVRLKGVAVRVRFESFKCGVGSTPLGFAASIAGGQFRVHGRLGSQPPRVLAINAKLWLCEVLRWRSGPAHNRVSMQAFMWH